MRGAAGNGAAAILLAVATGCTGGPFGPASSSPSAPLISPPVLTPSMTVAATQTAAPATPSATPTGWGALVFDRPASPALIQAVAPRGPNLVAVGGAGGAGAAWILERNGEWQRATSVPDARDDEIVTMVDVVAGSHGLVAVGIGGPPQSEPGFSVVWFSADGLRWREIKRMAGVLLDTVVSTPAGLIAAGGTGPAVGAPHGVALWNSADGGMTWTESDATDAFGRASITDILSTDQGLVAVGLVRDDPTAYDVRAAVWTSPSGETWTRVPHAPAFDASGISAVVIGPGAYVAVGSDYSAGTARPAVWTSGSGTEWQRSPVEAGPGAFTAVAATGQGFAAVGYSEADGELLLALWTSRDGVTWVSEPAVTAEGTGLLHDVIAFYGRLIAVGELTDAAAGEGHPIVISRPLS